MLLQHWNLKQEELTLTVLFMLYHNLYLYKHLWRDIIKENRDNLERLIIKKILSWDKIYRV